MADQLQAWRDGLELGSRVAVTYNGITMVGKLDGLIGWMPDGERRWAVVWDWPDPNSDQWEDVWNEPYLQPVPEPPVPKRRARTKSGG